MLERRLSNAARRRAFVRIARLGALATLLFPSTARGDDQYANFGIFFGYAFGERPSVEWGFFTNYVWLENGRRDCSTTDARSGHGPFAQFGMLGFSRPRVTLGAFAGTEFVGGGPTVVGEAGGSLRFDRGLNPGLHTGGLFEATWPHAYARQEWFMNEYSFGGGLSYLSPTLGLPHDCYRPVSIPGRPVRDDRGLRIGPLVRELGLAADAFAWYRDAETECASIRAFLDLSRELLAVGAPLALVHRALDAAEDEVRHAELCAAIAGAMAGRPLRPALVDPPVRPIPERDALLDRLAVESFVDGCLGEGSAAERARIAAKDSRHRALRAAHLRIARDEARHAELGWDIVRFALASGGRRVACALSPFLRGNRELGANELVAENARQRLTRELGLCA